MEIFVGSVRPRVRVRPMAKARPANALVAENGTTPVKDGTTPVDDGTTPGDDGTTAEAELSSS